MAAVFKERQKLLPSLSQTVAFSGGGVPYEGVADAGLVSTVNPFRVKGPKMSVAETALSPDIALLSEEVNLVDCGKDLQPPLRRCFPSLLTGSFQVFRNMVDAVR